MIQRTLPLYVSNNTITYTELRSRCSKVYTLRREALCAEVAESFETFMESKDEQEVCKALFTLNECGIELSCLDPAWEEFSVAVFEVMTLPGRPNSKWNKRQVKTAYEATLASLQAHQAGQSESAVSSSLPSA